VDARIRTRGPNCVVIIPGTALDHQLLRKTS
jgi:hypothetical protein